MYKHLWACLALYFDRKKETILKTDTSKKGFGAVILQKEQPIYYASRALTSAEKNYQNLEHEAQVAVWGIEKFHYFLYGRKFILQTDQKPLVSIFRKHMIDVSPRIQRKHFHRKRSLLSCEALIENSHQECSFSG